MMISIKRLSPIKMKKLSASKFQDKQNISKEPLMIFTSISTMKNKIIKSLISKLEKDQRWLYKMITERLDSGVSVPLLV